MTLKSFLTDIKTRMPNAFEEEQLIAWINTAIREVYKVMALQNGYTFTAISGRTLYPLPGEIAFELIRTVLADGVEYEPRRLGEDVPTHSWFKAAEGFMGFYPPPKGGTPITIFYHERPVSLLTAAEAQAAGVDYDTQPIALVADCMEMVKYAVFITIAEAREDVTLANNYKLSYNLLLSRAQQERYEREGKYPVTKIVNRKRRLQY